MLIPFSHQVHKHELKPKDFQKPYTCDGCKEQGFGIRYRCEQCDFNLHADCMHFVCTTTPTMSHPFFGKDTFKFLYQKPKGSTSYCDGCGKGIHGLHYHCEERGWDLHPCCAKLERELSIDDIKFKLQNKVSSKCICCKERKLKDTFSGIRGWAYESGCKEFNFHVYCATEMVLQAWKNGSLSKDMDNNCLTLQNLEHLPVQANYRNRNGRRGDKFVRIVKVLFKTIACILLGSLDPTLTLGCLLVDVFAN